jgi:hypothetical protein
LDAQYVEILGGALRGVGSVATGSGPIPGQVENRSGLVSPGDGVGQLEIVGRFANGNDGVLAFDVGGVAAGTQYDQLIVDGSVTVDGTLSVSLINAFSPSVGQTFTLITASEEIGGAFDQLLAPDGLNWKLYNTGSSLQLVVGNPGDFNQDGTVNAADFIVWRNNGMGPLNYQAWRTNFGVTYPGSGAGFGAAVPEPAAALLLVLSAPFIFGRGLRGGRRS